MRHIPVLIALILGAAILVPAAAAEAPLLADAPLDDAPDPFPEATTNPSVSYGLVCNLTDGEPSALCDANVYCCGDPVIDRLHGGSICIRDTEIQTPCESGGT